MVSHYLDAPYFKEATCICLWPQDHPYVTFCNVRMDTEVAACTLLQQEEFIVGGLSFCTSSGDVTEPILSTGEQGAPQLRMVVQESGTHTTNAVHLPRRVSGL
jgi:hypothetical protein